MLDQMFRFSNGVRSLIVGAKDEAEARSMLDVYITEHPNLSKEWTLVQILGKVSYGIFTL